MPPSQREKPRALKSLSGCRGPEWGLSINGQCGKRLRPRTPGFLPGGRALSLFGLGSNTTTQAWPPRIRGGAGGQPGTVQKPEMSAPWACDQGSALQPSALGQRWPRLWPRSPLRCLQHVLVPGAYMYVGVE